MTDRAAARLASYFPTSTLNDSDETNAGRRRPRAARRPLPHDDFGRARGGVPVGVVAHAKVAHGRAADADDGAVVVLRVHERDAVARAVRAGGGRHDDEREDDDDDDGEEIEPLARRDTQLALLVRHEQRERREPVRPPGRRREAREVRRRVGAIRDRVSVRHAARPDTDRARADGVVAVQRARAAHEVPAEHPVRLQGQRGRVQEVLRAHEARGAPSGAVPPDALGFFFFAACLLFRVACLLFPPSLPRP
eukprot:9001-Pelagococcus_subviridis.AAC.4